MSSCCDLDLKNSKLIFFHDTPSHDFTIPSLVTKWSAVQKISSRQTFTNILNLRCDLDLECSNPSFIQDTPAYDAVLQNQVLLQMDKQFRRYSRNSHILIIGKIWLNGSGDTVRTSLDTRTGLQMDSDSNKPPPPYLYRGTKKGGDVAWFVTQHVAFLVHVLLVFVYDNKNLYFCVHYSWDCYAIPFILSSFPCIVNNYITNTEKSSTFQNWTLQQTELTDLIADTEFTWRQAILCACCHVYCGSVGNYDATIFSHSCSISMCFLFLVSEIFTFE